MDSEARRKPGHDFDYSRPSLGYLAARLFTTVVYGAPGRHFNSINYQFSITMYLLYSTLLARCASGLRVLCQTIIWFGLGKRLSMLMSVSLPSPINFHPVLLPARIRIRMDACGRDVFPNQPFAKGVYAVSFITFLDFLPRYLFSISSARSALLDATTL